ncbi:ABC transport system ATP-binding protein [Candidatus Kinetoplastibacterium blastocrithidii TCC012E]|uniref:ABC transport system ATP-binding protein n=1 Tax=Candidatus Kinetoplastidibacterium blastocrithidiae TCC012E TaxID=1208922 RepID=M1MCG0_9PROT|nr:ATP-binding cassette domain-containing protein [Candidatus Kinetoplastibacterium blastocrithidii]AFZ83387.1 ABC transport system ATP-binding protein [Candidatus Kinetoplastibacterium blastocrithidii (ex Strigomonas culicis)]AGF49485.1 ABC transport system ATP-binding protein [Candidatus Kinetoplastibacterium blastocrithidii TCC012E]
MKKDNDVILSIQDLTVGYGESIILNNISMDVRKKEIVAIMGGSGSGKTTLFKSITNQIPIINGKVKIFDQDIRLLQDKDLKNLRSKMGVLFQHGALFTDLNVFDNVAFPLIELTKIPIEEIIKIVLEKLDSVGLKAAAHMPVTTLSGGMAKRVALARAIALDPWIMLYDEPFSGLDPISMGVIAKLIKELSNTLQCASILITHEMQESFRIADTINIIGNGSIIASGSPESLSRSEDPFVKQFINGAPTGPVPFNHPETYDFKEWLLKLRQQI